MYIVINETVGDLVKVVTRREYYEVTAHSKYNFRMGKWDRNKYAWIVPKSKYAATRIFALLEQAKVDLKKQEQHQQELEKFLQAERANSLAGEYILKDEQIVEVRLSGKQYKILFPLWSRTKSEIEFKDQLKTLGAMYHNMYWLLPVEKREALANLLSIHVVRTAS